MAVLRQELNWSTYQDKQLKVLQNLEHSFNDSLKISKMIKQDFSEVSRSLNSIAAATDALLRSTYANTGATRNATSSVNSFSSALNQSTSKVHNTMKIYDAYGNVISDVAKKQEEAQEEMQRQLEERRRSEEEYDILRRRREEETQRERGELLEGTISKVQTFLNVIARPSNEYSEMSNNFIKMAETSMEVVGEFRNEVVHTISAQLNKDTDYFYDPKQVYSQMLSIAESANIGNINTLKEITRPIMLAQETMNINLGSMSKLLGRWNTRYSFSSIAMEEMVNDIRGYTSNNLASAERVQENLIKLENWMAYYTGGNEEKLSGMTEEVAKGTAWLESMNVDTTRYTDYLADIASGNAATNSQLIQVLNESGISAIQAQDLFSTGNIAELYQALYEGEARVFDKINNQNLIGPAATAFGMEVGDLLDAYNSRNASNYITLDEFDILKSDTDSTEIIAGKYNSVSDKISNQLSGLAEYTASLQEITGVGFDDVSRLLTLLLASTAVLNGISRATSAFPRSLEIIEKIKNSLGAGVAGAGATVSSLLGSIGGALGATGTGAIVAGGATVAAVAGGILAITKTIKDTMDIKEAWEKQTYEGSTQILKDEASGNRTTIEVIYEPDEKGNMSPSLSYGSTSDTSYDTKGAIEDAYGIMEKSIKDKYDDNNFILNTVLGFGSTDRWTKYVPVVGELIESFYKRAELKGLNKSEDFQKRYYDWADSLDEQDMTLAQAYTSKMIKTEDQLEFFVDNFKKFKNLSEKGLAATSIDKDGLKDTGSRQSILGYRRGTNYIDEDQLAYLHEGEAVVPKQYNPSANMTELEFLREKLKQTEETRTPDNLEILRESVAILSEIKEFLAVWKSDKERNDMVTESRNRFSANNSYISSYLKDGFGLV